MKWLILTVLVMSLGLLPAIAKAQEVPTSCDTQPTEIVDENCFSNEQVIQQTEEVPTDETPIEKGQPDPETVAGTPAELAPQSEVLGATTTTTPAPTLVDTGAQTWPFVIVGILIMLESITLATTTRD